MEMRQFGRTGMRLSVLGFGCDAVGGLMVRGDPLDQAQVAEARNEEAVGTRVRIGLAPLDRLVRERCIGRCLIPSPDRD